VSIIARNFRKLFFLALVGGLALGAVMARRGMQVDLGTIGGVQLVLAAPAVTKTPAVPAGSFPTGATSLSASGQPATAAATPAAGVASGRPATGTVQKVDGKTISVTAQDGTVTNATVSDTTTYVKDGAITLADIKIGDTVTAVGQAGSDGAITATQVTVGAVGQASALGAGGFTRQGGAGSGGASGQGATGGTGRAGAAGGQSANVSVVTGAVQKSDGTTLTVAVEGGQLTKVTLGANGRVQQMSAGTLADVTAGSQVTIAGQAGTDGTIAATVVQISASM
jgi:Cu/Ag efflux protein CusF